MKKIIFATTVFDDVSTGPGTFAKYLWEYFSDSGEFEFHLVAPNVRSVSHDNVHSFSGDSFPNLHVALCREVEKVEEKCGPIDIVHCNNAHSMGSLKTSAKLVCQINDYEVASVRSNFLKQIRSKGFNRCLRLIWRYFQEKKVLKRCERVICNSEYVRKIVTKSYNISSLQAQVIYKAVDLSAFKEAKLRESRSASSDCGLKLIFVGSNWRIKGLDLLLEAIILILPDLPNIQLCVIGKESEPQNVIIRSKYKSLELDGHVTYVGRLDKNEIAQLMHLSDIAVLPSRQEALGVALLEAMASGTPVIASNVGGIPEILNEGQAGVLFDVDDALALASAIKSLSNSELDRMSYRSIGLERSKYFSKEIMFDQLTSLYRELSA